MKPETQPNSKQFWEDHVNHWNKTSLSQASYCQEHELSIKRFGYWKRKLLGATKLTASSKKVDGFIQISPKHCPPPTLISALVIELPNQLRIEGVTADNLQLVKQLAGLLQ